MTDWQPLTLHYVISFPLFNDFFYSELHPMYEKCYVTKVYYYCYYLVSAECCQLGSRSTTEV